MNAIIPHPLATDAFENICLLPGKPDSTQSHELGYLASTIVSHYIGSKVTTAGESHQSQPLFGLKSATRTTAWVHGCDEQMPPIIFSPRVNVPMLMPSCVLHDLPQPHTSYPLGVFLGRSACLCAFSSGPTLKVTVPTAGECVATSSIKRERRCSQRPAGLTLPD